MSDRTRMPEASHERWMSVVFLQGDEADRVLDMIDVDGVDAAVTYLGQWDYGDETRDAALINGYVYDEVPQSPTDRVVLDDESGHALTYNRSFGYVSLLRRFTPIDDEPPATPPPARRTAALASLTPRVSRRVEPAGGLSR